MGSQAAEFATHRPGYWQRVASTCAHDFLAYVVFCHGHLPAAPRYECGECGAARYPDEDSGCLACGSFKVQRIPSHHEIIAERLLYGGMLELILGPPGFAKTTLGVAFAEWTEGRDPNYRWLVASEVAAGIATSVVTQIGETIAQNERYHMVFGHLQDPSGKGEWSSHSIRLRTYVSPRDARRLGRPATPAPYPWLLTPELNTPSGVVAINPLRGRRPGLAHANVRAVSWRSGYTGVRCEGILADDLVSDKSSRSQVVTAAVHRTLHQKLLARFDPAAPVKRCIMFGQRWAPRDLYGMLLEKGCVVADNNPHREGLEVLDRELQAA